MLNEKRSKHSPQLAAEGASTSQKQPSMQHISGLQLQFTHLNWRERGGEGGRGGEREKVRERGRERGRKGEGAIVGVAVFSVFLLRIQLLHLSSPCSFWLRGDMV